MRGGAHGRRGRAAGGAVLVQGRPLHVHGHVVRLRAARRRPLLRRRPRPRLPGVRAPAPAGRGGGAREGHGLRPRASAGNPAPTGPAHHRRRGAQRRERPGGAAARPGEKPCAVARGSRPGRPAPAGRAGRGAAARAHRALRQPVLHSARGRGRGRRPPHRLGPGGRAQPVHPDGGGVRRPRDAGRRRGLRTLGCLPDRDGGGAGVGRRAPGRHAPRVRRRRMGGALPPGRRAGAAEAAGAHRGADAGERGGGPCSFPADGAGRRAHARAPMGRRPGRCRLGGRADRRARRPGAPLRHALRPGARHRGVRGLSGHPPRRRGGLPARGRRSACRARWPRELCLAGRRVSRRSAGGGLLPGCAHPPGLRGVGLLPQRPRG